MFPSYRNATPDLPSQVGTDRTRKVGNEFSSVEALWSQFENVMAKEPEESNVKAEEQGDGRMKADQTKNDDGQA